MLVRLGGVVVAGALLLVGAPPTHADSTPFRLADAWLSVSDHTGVLVELSGDGSGTVRGRKPGDGGPFTLDAKTTAKRFDRFVEMGMLEQEGERPRSRLVLQDDGMARIHADAIERTRQLTVSYRLGGFSGSVTYDPREPGAATPLSYAVEELLTSLLPDTR